MRPQRYINNPQKPKKGRPTSPEFKKASLCRNERINFKAIVLSFLLKGNKNGK